GGGFRNPWVAQAVPGFGGLLKWVLVHRTTRPRPKDPDPSAFTHVAPAFVTPRAPATRLTLPWVGHASLLLQIDGLNRLGDTLWCGFVVSRANGRRVYFAGDTGFHPEFGKIGERYGPFDLALLPIGAYEPRWFMRYLHMNPEEAVEAFRAVNARLMVPIHWGTFKLTDEAMDEPPLRARGAWQTAGLAPDGYRQLAHGETLTL